MCKKFLIFLLLDGLDLLLFGSVVVDLGSCCYRHGDLGIFLVFAHRSKVMLFQDLCRYKSMPSNVFFDAVWIVELKESV
ncbi:unnamed protein product [Camellia sinensis]